MKTAGLYAIVFASILAFAFGRARFVSAASHGPGDSPPSASGSSTGAAPASSSAAPALSSVEAGWVGVLLARRAVDVAPRTASLVRTVSARAGDVVQRGAVLATLEARDKVARARAADATHKSQMERAARNQRMHAASLVSAEEAETSRFEEERQGAELDLARLLVDDAIVRAPFDGTIVARFTEPGMHVAAGTPMFRIIDTSGSRLRFGVLPEIADALRIGQSVSFVASSTGLRGGARLTSISPEVDRSTGLVVIEADAGFLQGIRSGCRVRVLAEATP